MLVLLIFTLLYFKPGYGADYGGSEADNIVLLIKTPKRVSCKMCEYKSDEGGFHFEKTQYEHVLQSSMNSRRKEPHKQSGFLKTDQDDKWSQKNTQNKPYVNFEHDGLYESANIRKNFKNYQNHQDSQDQKYIQDRDSLKNYEWPQESKEDDLSGNLKRDRLYESANIRKNLKNDVNYQGSKTSKYIQDQGYLKNYQRYQQRTQEEPSRTFENDELNNFANIRKNIKNYKNNQASETYRQSRNQDSLIKHRWTPESTQEEPSRNFERDGLYKSANIRKSQNHQSSKTSKYIQDQDSLKNYQRSKYDQDEPSGNLERDGLNESVKIKKNLEHDLNHEESDKSGFLKVQDPLKKQRWSQESTQEESSMNLDRDGLYESANIRKNIRKYKNHPESVKSEFLKNLDSSKEYLWSQENALGDQSWNLDNYGSAKMKGPKKNKNHQDSKKSRFLKNPDSSNKTQWTQESKQNDLYTDFDSDRRVTNVESLEYEKHEEPPKMSRYLKDEQSVEKSVSLKNPLNSVSSYILSDNNGTALGITGNQKVYLENGKVGVGSVLIPSLSLYYGNLRNNELRRKGGVPVQNSGMPRNSGLPSNSGLAY